MRSLKYFCACAVLILAACSKDKADISKTMLALNLQSGGSVSSDTADDLYPQLVQPGNGTITLFFVSNRTTGNGCSATAYCIFVSQSTTGYSDGNAALPRFTDPVALNVSGTAVTSTNAQGIAAFYDGTVPGYKIVYSDNTNAVKLATLPTANLSTGTLQAAAATESGPSGARTGAVNGALNNGGMFYMLGDGGATQKKTQVATSGDAGAQVCAITDNCRWITYIRSAGANGLDFLHISTDGLLYRSSGGSSRAAESFNKTLAKGGLKLSGLSSLGHGNSDLLLVSANTGGQNDLYVLNTPIKTAVTVVGAPPPVGVVGSASAAAVTGVVVSTTATRVYGQPNLTTANAGSTTSSTFNNPHDVSVDATGVYVADQSNARVVFFPGTATVATRVYGQSGDLACAASYRQAGSCTAGAIGAQGNIGLSSNTPGVHVDSNGVYVTDIGGHRILFYPGTSTTPTRVYGQGGSFLTGATGLNADSLNNPQGVATDATGVYVVDNGNNRVLFYPGTSTTATRVYGQGAAGTNFAANATGATATALNGPRGIHVDSTGVYVADMLNSRVVFYPGTSVTATRVYGQYNDLACGTANRASGSCVGGTVTASTLNQPLFVTGAGTHLYIADRLNNRVLHYSGTSTTADLVIGQNGSFTTATANIGTIGANGANALSTPIGIKLGNDGLYVTDYTNQRVVFYPPDTTAPVISAVAPATASSPSDAKVSYTLSESCASASVTWTRSGGTADGASPHVKALTGTELTVGTKTNITLTNNPTLVVGAIYSVAFNCTDAAGLAATTVTSTNVTQTQGGWYTFSGTGAGVGDKLNAVAATSDGGFLTAFSRYNIATMGGLSPIAAYSGAAHMLAVMKYSASGALQWFTRASKGCNFLSGGALTQSSDGGYFVVGTCYSADAPSAPSAGLVAISAPVGANIVKLNSSGAQVWSTYVNGDYPVSVIATSDGGAVLCSNSNGTNNVTTLDTVNPKNPATASQGQGHLVKYGSDGHVVWHTFFGGSSSSNLQKCSSAASDSILVAGAVSTPPVYATDAFYTQTQTLAVPNALIAHGGAAINNSWLLKFNSSGEVVWHTYSGSNPDHTSFNDVTELSDGSIVAGGTVSTANAGNYGVSTIYAFQTGASSNLHMVKFSSTGTPIWQTFAGAAANNPSGFKLDKTSTGFAVATSYNISNFSISGTPPLRNHTGTDYDYWLGNYNSSGGIVWHTFIGGAGNQLIGDFKSFAVSSSGNFGIGGIANNASLTFSPSPTSPVTAAGSATDSFLIQVPQNGVFE